MSDLPELLDYVGEFGPELVLFLPFVTWLSREGLLRRRRIGTYEGMRCFYEDLDCAGIVEKPGPRRYVRAPDRLPYLPERNEHRFAGRSERLVFPDLRRKFREHPIPHALAQAAATRSLLVVHNKHGIEWWGRGPFNHMSAATLDAIFALEDTFTIVYVRHGMTGALRGYSADHNRPLPFDDRAILARHRGVWCFDDLAAEDGTDVNRLKNAIYARCFHFVSSQGGGAHHCAYFSGSMLAVLHRRGKESRFAYGRGYYDRLSDPAPVRFICASEAELVDAVRSFADSSIEDSRAVPGPSSAALAGRLSPRSYTRRRVVEVAKRLLPR
ncbi:MAG TPA: hypothetical protein VHZ73_09895 [Vicinamibacterales bacterium]|jgi:hypothetical protein|nr:hypothetical protein [Vicinamibacterales bacterium]